ncbi:MAG: hypothetical protein V4438_04375 [Patescibacteria group bacterium]
MKDTIEIPRKWLERLMQVAKFVDKSQDYKIKNAYISQVLGYIESAEYLLDNKQ